MKLFLLREGNSANLRKRVELLQHAAAARNIEVEDIDSTLLDYSQIPRPNENDLLYNVGRGARQLESILLQPEVTTFYSCMPELNQYVSSTDWAIVHAKHGLPAPKTIEAITTDRARLRNYVEHLGGFPVILKIAGGSRGVGAIRADSYPALFSLVDYLFEGNDRFVMRQFIAPKNVGRLIVLGDQVIAANEKFVAPDDFRTSVESQMPVSTKYSSAVEATAIAATRLLNLDFSGVDIIFDDQGQHYLLEVNFPCDFILTQEVTGVAIAGKMIEFLIRKKEQQRKASLYA